MFKPLKDYVSLIDEEEYGPYEFLYLETLRVTAIDLDLDPIYDYEEKKRTSDKENWGVYTNNFSSAKEIYNEEGDDQHFAWRTIFLTGNSLKRREVEEEAKKLDRNPGNFYKNYRKVKKIYEVVYGESHDFGSYKQSKAITREHIEKIIKQCENDDRLNEKIFEIEKFYQQFKSLFRKEK